MSITSILGTSGDSAATQRSQGTAASGVDFRAIIDAFTKEAAKTPAERARDEVLKKHDLTEEDYRALPAQEREAINREIAEAVQRTLRRPQGTREA